MELHFAAPFCFMKVLNSMCAIKMPFLLKYNALNHSLSIRECFKAFIFLFSGGVSETCFAIYKLHKLVAQPNEFSGMP